MTGEKNTLDMYTVSFDNEDIVHNQACYVLTLTAKSRTVAYPVQKIWVDKETYIVHKGQYSSATGRLLKEFEVLETKVIDNRTIPVKTKISDILKKDSYTVMAIEELQIDIPLDANIFTLQSLMW
jgi:outer membrane lipoprotein-sorting protein